MKNVCIVGYGAIGPVHAMAIKRTNNANFYAVCDIETDRIAVCKETYDVKAYDNFDRMLCDVNIDSVHICTPHHLHFEMVKKALAAGKSVVVEKPVTRTKEEFERLLKLENSDKVCIVFQNRLNPCIMRLQKIVQSGEMGSVKAAKAILTWYRSPDYYRADDWRGKTETEGGGVLINQAIHTLDYFCYLIDDVQSVKAQMANFSIAEISVEDTFCAFLELKNGAHGIFFATNAYADNSAPIFEVLFEKGKVLYEDGKLLKDGKIIQEDSIPTFGKSYWGGGHEALLRKYYDDGEYFSINDVKNVMYTVFAMYESAKRGAEKQSIQ